MFYHSFVEWQNFAGEMQHTITPDRDPKHQSMDTTKVQLGELRSYNFVMCWNMHEGLLKRGGRQLSSPENLAQSSQPSGNSADWTVSFPSASCLQQLEAGQQVSFLSRKLVWMQNLLCSLVLLHWEGLSVFIVYTRGRALVNLISFRDFLKLCWILFSCTRRFLAEWDLSVFKASANTSFVRLQVHDSWTWSYIHPSFVYH